MKKDYIKCVRKHKDKMITWCGRTEQMGEWLFEDAEYAVKTAYSESGLRICKECGKELIYFLKKGMSK